MDKRTEAKGIVTEIVREEMVAAEEKIAAQAEANAKILEANAELKASLESLQGKVATMNTKVAGPVELKFAGMNPNMSKNWKANFNSDQKDAIAKAYCDMANGNTKAFTATDYLSTGFGNVIMGLAELNSVALTDCTVMTVKDGVTNLPVKGSRVTSTDAQGKGTANAEADSEDGKVTLTIDTRIGSYYDVNKEDIDDANFDFINQWIIPSMAEGIGQYIDAEVFLGTNAVFTHSIDDVTQNQVSEADPADLVSFAHLNTLYNGIEWTRKLKAPKWYGPQGVYKDIMGLVGTANDHPIYLRDLTAAPSMSVMGLPFVVTPAIANDAAAGAMRYCIADLSSYVIGIRGPMDKLINPFILGKEFQVQFALALRADGVITSNATAASATSICVARHTA